MSLFLYSTIKFLVGVKDKNFPFDLCLSFRNGNKDKIARPYYYHQQQEVPITIMNNNRFVVDVRIKANVYVNVDLPTYNVHLCQGIFI